MLDRSHLYPDSPVAHHDVSVSGFPHYWQVPAATEKAAFESMISCDLPGGAHYLGIPWATIIDGVRGRSPKVPTILRGLNEICGKLPTRHTRRATVAQHIHALKFTNLFRAAGITDLFWSHAVHGQTDIHGIRLHPFPLYPAQAPAYEPSPARSKKHLANFVGAFNPKIYLTNVRQKIFDDAGKHEDILIVRRDRWHFDRAVYDEQISGERPEEAQLIVEERMRQEYRDAIRYSWFTLCPTGSGPNSIRIFEALNLGSIPIVLSRELHLAGPSKLWQEAAIIEEDSEAGYRRAMERARRMPKSECENMLALGRDLANQISPAHFNRLTIRCLDSSVN